jgi:MFS superfamily sulfate permease-like transporter
MPDRDIDLWVEVIGWVGSVEILLAYGLNIYGKIRSNSVAFSLLNLTGGLLLIVYTMYKEAFPSAFINLIWVIIALISLGKLHHKSVTKNAGT